MARKNAIVIGVGPDRGLGAQLCHRFAAEGLHVLVAGRSPDKLESVAESIRRDGGSAESVVADATSESDTRALFDAAGDSLDLAIYNAGNNTPGRIADMDADYFEQSWRVCCFGGFPLSAGLLGIGADILVTWVTSECRGGLERVEPGKSNESDPNRCIVGPGIAGTAVGWRPATRGALAAQGQRGPIRRLDPCAH